MPLGASFKEMGLRPSFFADAGALFGLDDPITQNIGTTCANATTGVQTTFGPGAGCPTGTVLVSRGFAEIYSGDTARPRISVGFGVNWNSPFGPFRIDIAKALTKSFGDDTKLLTFNVGTAF